jgi:hypothetical protein
MNMRPTPRSITWTAHNCNYSDADVYLGLAPGIEDASLRQMFSDEQLRAYPGRDIPITSHAGASLEVPLRLYALRDAELCEVKNLGVASDVKGFHRVKLGFFPPRRSNGHSTPDIDAETASETPKIVAFLITLGLTLDQEEHFFTDIVGEFLEHSWSSLPQLLREVGCAEPSAA